MTDMFHQYLRESLIHLIDEGGANFFHQHPICKFYFDEPAVDEIRANIYQSIAALNLISILGESSMFGSKAKINKNEDTLFLSGYSSFVEHSLYLYLQNNFLPPNFFFLFIRGAK